MTSKADRLPITAAVLAGGRSTRMGVDKTLLDVQGRPLMLRVIDAVAEACDEVLIVTNRPDALSDPGLVDDIPVLTDEVAYQGPLGGLATAMASAGNEWVLAVAADMPHLSADVVRVLWDARKDADVVVPVSERGPEPLLALYRVEACLPPARTVLELGRRRLIHIFPSVRVTEVPEEAFREVDPQLLSLVNVNTPGDLAEARDVVANKAVQALTVEQARAVVFSALTPMPAEEVSIVDALGRVLAEDMVSDIDVAPFDNSAMDGFAVRAADLSGATADCPVELEVIGHIAAGDAPEVFVDTGQAARIMTGAPMPEGADSVVMVERTRAVRGDGGTGSRVAFELEPALGQHVRRRGEEVSAGDVVLSAGEVVGPAAIGLLASTGHDLVPVVGRPRVAIIATGSELVEVAERPGPGKIRNSNSYSIAGQVLAAGAIPVQFPVVPDDIESTREAFERAAEECDYIVASGGVSVGDFDYVKPVLEELGEIMFCNVAMRPGNPQTLGSIRGVPFFGLPGNPTSTYVGFEVFVRPALRRMMGRAELDRPVTRARLSHNLKKRPGRRYYLRGRIERDEGRGPTEGECSYVVSLSGSQSSALLTSAHRGNCLIVPPDADGFVEADTVVDCIRLDMEEGTP